MTEAPETAEDKRIRFLEQVEQLPQGSIVHCNEGILQLRDALDDKFKSFLPEEHVPPKRVSRTLRPLASAFIDCYWNEEIKQSLDRFLEEFPNLCWVRGTSLTEDRMTSVIIDSSMDGMVGELPLSFAYTSYTQEKRRNPGLVFVPLKQVIKSAVEQKLHIGSHHGYDLTLSYRGEGGMAQWIRQSAWIVDLDGIEKDFAKEHLAIKQKEI